ncbi:electron transfer flavoprotein subunit alpha/FixB family protein [Yinghuangia sp. ASG 101]|uniref:electron transfer flavoprotein subunit alpha/FixB family protein n=1 Tax=Yinghuangia sp. ASG 101 TaxID=2896848 RepID=UPI001E4AD459|nr:electron transfer flavoprotein subunit alpha/FixB family protein [Yinghuangia sp. ASG 101]UGQ10413.1 electron transfer flavoprotein subunit alpha/FixB family protein [Yinghuangia sp. ASG 101]
MRPVLVLVESHEESVRDRTFELLTIARRLGDPVAVVRHPADAASVAALGRYGAKRVCVVESAVPDAGPVAVAVEGLAELAWQMAVSAVLTGAGREGREVAARTSVRLGAGIVTGAVDVHPGPDGPVTVQNVCDGAYRVESVVRGDTPVITVAPGAVAAAPAPVVPVVERVRVRPAEPARAVRVLARTPKRRRPAVSGAAVVVAGGRGVGSADGFALIEKVADALGAAVGGTHAAADLGWCAHDALIGQTGAIVHPRLYLACGISGSVHHRAGMRHASTIVAIDTDPSAPIFRIADVGVVGDLHEVLPALLAELDRGRRGRSPWEA